MIRKQTYIVKMDKRTVRACSNVYNSDYIIEKIFMCLNLEDQLIMANVCKRFKYIITKFVWPKTACYLNIHKTPYVNIITNSMAIDKDKDNKTKIALSHKQCNDFLFLNAKNVEVLKIHSEFYDYKQEMGVSFKNVEVFRNLTYLSYYRMVVNNEQLKLVAQKCLNLQKLHLLECYCDHLKSIVPGLQIDLNIIIAMKKLHELVIHNQPTAENCVIESKDLHKILRKCHLKCLVLKNFIIDDNYAEHITSICSTMEILNMGIISMNFLSSFMFYLKHFEHLKELTINVSDCNTTINVQIIDTLATKCKNLQSLSLENCDLCVDDLTVLHELNYLSLTSCGGLTFANFQQIMGGLKLKTFLLINTRIYGVINHIYISPSLESITIDTIRFTEISDAFQKSLNQFDNLHTLNWLNGDINDNWIIDKCPKLQYLHIPNPYLLRRIVFTMKSLKELTFTSCSGLSWCFILILIKNLTLKRLNLQTNDLINDDKEIPLNAGNTLTTLDWMTIPFNIFKIAQTFWLDLLYLNENLNILIYGKHEDLLDAIFLNNLIEDDVFRQHVKSMKICGFIIDCNDLHEDFNVQLHKLNKHTSHYRSKSINFTMQL